MKLGHQHVFDVRQPPAGGLQRLRARLDDGHRRASLGRVLWIGAAAVVAAGVAIAVSSSGVELRSTSPAPLPGAQEMLPVLAGLGMAAAPDEPVSVPDEARARIAVERVALPTDDVVYYWVASAEPESATEQPFK